MSLGSDVMPWWLIGNPYGPVPGIGNNKFFYFNKKDHRVGPFDTKEEAQKDKDASDAMQDL